MSEKVRDKDIIARVRMLRIRFAGERGKSKFARALGLPPSTYNYYEQDRVPPIPVAIRMCELTNTPLQWLLLGEHSSVSGSLERASERAALLERVRFLLENYPPAGASLEAFVDFLMRRSGLQSARQDGQQQLKLREVGSDEAGWVPVLGRTAGGLSRTLQQDAVTNGLQERIDRIIERYIGGEAMHSCRCEVAAIPDGALPEPEPVAEGKLLTVVGGRGSEVMEFVTCPTTVRTLPRGLFALHVDGRAMEPMLQHGDVALLSPSQPARDGDVAVVKFADCLQLYCRIVRYCGQRVHLLPINENFSPRVVARRKIAWALSVLYRLRPARNRA